MKKTKINFSLPITILKEGNRFIAYTPALDLSTSGKTYNEVKERFVEAVEIFFEETAAQDTLKEVLIDLGWKKVQKEWKPPVVVSHETEDIKVYA